MNFMSKIYVATNMKAIFSTFEKYEIFRVEIKSPRISNINLLVRYYWNSWNGYNLYINHSNIWMQKYRWNRGVGGGRGCVTNKWIRQFDDGAALQADPVLSLRVGIQNGRSVRSACQYILVEEVEAHIVVQYLQSLSFPLNDHCFASYLPHECAI